MNDALNDAWLNSFTTNLSALGVTVHARDLDCIADELIALFGDVHPADAAAACAPHLGPTPRSAPTVLDAVRSESQPPCRTREVR